MRRTTKFENKKTFLDFFETEESVSIYHNFEDHVNQLCNDSMQVAVSPREVARAAVISSALAGFCMLGEGEAEKLFGEVTKYLKENPEYIATFEKH